MLHLCQFNLQLAFCGSSTLSKNIQNQIRAINHSNADTFFNISDLDRRKLMIKYYQRGICMFNRCRNFLDLTAAHKSR